MSLLNNKPDFTSNATPESSHEKWKRENNEDPPIWTQRMSLNGEQLFQDEVWDPAPVVIEPEMYVEKLINPETERFMKAIAKELKKLAESLK